MPNTTKNTVGRITYVEPTFSDPNNYTNMSNGQYGTDNIVFNQEDYCISADLQIIIPDRKDCGGIDYYNQRELNFRLDSSKYGTFMGGETLNDENGKSHAMLTTSYSDLSYNKNGDTSNKENLGIESIDVDFNQYMYPVVTIRFIDVRGFGMMMPEEDSYVEREKSKRNANGGQYNLNAEKSSGSFFKALFNFPYPLFLLKIKGFYGDAVTFQLSVQDFNSSFDSTTGNFVTTVTFIGYMYGVYTDIPMKYLLAAPYDKYAGAEYWEKQNFTFDDSGAKIPKYKELLKNISEANTKVEQISNTNINVRKYKQYTQQISAIEAIIENYKAFKNSLGDGDEGRIVGSKYILILGYFTDDNGSKIGKYDGNLFRAFYESVESYNNCGWDKIKIPNGDIIGVKYPMDELFSVTEAEDENGEKVPTVEFLYLSNGNLSELKNKIAEDEILNRLIGESGEYRFKNVKKLHNKFGYLYEEGGFQEDLETKVAELRENQKKINTYISNILNKQTEDVIGFKPSIRNVYKIIFAYMDTFMHSYYSCLQNVKLENRTFSDLGIQSTQTDVKTNVDSNVFVPPFPLITDYEKISSSENRKPSKAAIWPGELPEGNAMPEVSLINGVINGIIKLNEFNKDIESFISSFDNGKQFIPINTTDILMGYNPYAYIYDNNTSKIKIDELLTFFGLRAMNYLLFQNGENRSNTLFGECEAYNYYYSHPNYDQELMDFLMSTNCSGDNFIKFLKNEDNIYSINGEQFYSATGGNFGEAIVKKLDDWNLRYQWVKLTEKVSTYLPVNFKTIEEIKYVTGELTDDSYINDDNFNSMFLTTYYDAETEDKLSSDKTNNNVFAILEEGSYNKLMNLKNSVNGQELTYIIDKDKIFDGWDLDFVKYAELYSENDTIGLKNKGEKTKIGKNTNALFKDKAYDNTVVIYSDSSIKFSKFFNFKGKTSEVIKDVLTKKKNINDVFLPTLQINKNSSLYGNPFFYLQNENGDEELKLYRKALLFLHSLPYSMNTLKAFTNRMREHLGLYIQMFPKGLLLFIGGLLWRRRYCQEKGVEDCFNYGSLYLQPDGKNDETHAYDYLLISNYNSEENLSLNVARTGNNWYQYATVKKIFAGDVDGYGLSPFDLRKEVQTSLINYFTNWVNDSNGFKFINDCLELKFFNGKELNWDKITDIYFCYSYFLNNRFNTLNDADREDFNSELKEMIGETPYFADSIKTLYDFLSSIFSENAYKHYEKIGMSEDRASLSFMLLHNQSSMNINELTKLFMIPVPIYTSSVMRAEYFGDSRWGISIDKLKSQFNAFKNAMGKIYKYDDQEQVDKRTQAQVSSNTQIDEIKLAMYLHMKNLYDRWLCTCSSKKWKLSEPHNFYEDFCIVDSHYNDIGNDLIVDCNVIFDLFKDSVNSPSNDKKGVKNSVYEVITSIAEKSNCLFLALPIGNSFTNPEKLYHMFTPHPYGDASLSGFENGTSFICMYLFNPSHNLNIEDENYDYKNDGFDISGILTSNNEGIPEDMLGEGKYSIPCFGVTYAKQNQSFFKKIDVNMDSPIATLESMSNTLMLAQSGDDGSNNKLIFQGQNLYDIYANRSYTCSVDMMGCAPIMPLMLFQLNNIPLFRGAYLIINVKHHIEAGNMTTTFTGVRQNRNKLPLNTKAFALLSSDDKIGGNSSNTNIFVDESNINDYSMSNFNIAAFKAKYRMPTALENDDAYVYDYVSKLKDKNGKPLIIFDEGELNESGGAEEAYDNSQLVLRKLIVDIARTVDYNTTDCKLRITSMKRKGEGSSFHLKGLAADLSGCKVDENGKIINDKEYSNILFDIIATSFTPYIRELIWENTKNDESILRSYFVENCVHLSACECGQQEKIEIFQAINTKKGYSSVKITDKENFSPLSESFLSTCAELVSSGVIELNNINNFQRSGLTDDEAKNNLLKYKIKRS